jgi:hypothetical protein
VPGEATGGVYKAYQEPSALDAQRAKNAAAVQSAMTEQQGIATQQAAARAPTGGFGPLDVAAGRTAERLASDAYDAIYKQARELGFHAKTAIEQIGKGNFDFSQWPDQPEYSDVQEHPYTRLAMGMSKQEQDIAEGEAAARGEKEPVGAFVGSLAAMPAQFLEPKSLAAMLITHAPSEAMMESPVVQKMLGGIAAKVGPKIAGEVESLLQSSVGTGNFSAARRSMEDGTMGDVSKAWAQGAGQGVLLHGIARGAQIPGEIAAAGRERRAAIQSRLNEPGQGEILAAREAGAGPAPEPAAPGTTPAAAPEVQGQAAQAAPSQARGQTPAQSPEAAQATSAKSTPEPPEVVALRAKLDQSEAAMDEAKRAMQPSGEPKDIEDLAGRFEQARSEWQRTYTRYQIARVRAGLPPDAREAPSMFGPASSLETPPEATNAQQNGETGAVHGNVRTQPGEGQGQVPAAEGQPGVQPSGQGREVAPPAPQVKAGAEGTSGAGNAGSQPVPDVKQPWEMTREEWQGGGEIGQAAGVESITSPRFATEAEARDWGATRGLRGSVASRRVGKGPKTYTFEALAGAGADVDFARTRSIFDPHRNAVAEALRQGKPVPPEVLKDYPDLKPKPPIPADLKALSKPDLQALAQAHGVPTNKVRSWIEGKLSVLRDAQPGPNEGAAGATPPVKPPAAEAGEGGKEGNAKEDQHGASPKGVSPSTEPTQPTGTTQAQPEGESAESHKKPESMTDAELRAELEEAGVDTGAEPRESLVEGVTTLRKMLAGETGPSGAPPLGSPPATGTTGKTVPGTPTEAMGAAASASLRPKGGGGIFAGIKDFAARAVDRLRGVEYPKTHHDAPEAAQALREYAGSGLESNKAQAADRITRVMPKTYGDEPARQKFGTALAEVNLRRRRQQLVDAGDTAAAAKVKTLVGTRDSAFPDEKAFLDYVHSPEAQAQAKAHKQGPQAETQEHHTALKGKLREGGAEGYGEFTDAFVNMKAVMDDAKPSGKGGGIETLTRGSRHSKQFSGTAAKYETDYQKQLEHMFSNLPEIKKRAAMQAVEDSGIAERRSLKQGKPEGPEWEDAHAVPVEIKGVPRFDKDGEQVGARTHWVNMWFKDKAHATEFRAAFNAELTERASLAARFFNAAQMQAPTDAFTHMGNGIMAVGGIPEGKPTAGGWLLDVLRRQPGFNMADAGIRIGKAVSDAIADSPEYRAAVAKLHDVGAARPGTPEPTTTAGKINAKVNPFAYLGKAVHAWDTAARVAVVRAAEEAQRNGAIPPGNEHLQRAVSQLIGNYNPRMMSGPQRVLRSLGLSPFIVAGRNFNRLAMRRLLQMPEFKAANGAARARMVSSTIAGTVGSFVVPSILNYARTGQVAPYGIPYGAVYIKTRDDGTVVYFDPQRFTGLRRASRMLGIEAASGAAREGKPIKEIIGRGAGEAVASNLRPFTGPAVDTAATLTTGHTATGFPEAKDLHGRGVYGAQFVENAKAAAENINPILREVVDPRSPDPWVQRYMKKLGNSLGYQEKKGTAPALRDPGTISPRQP